MNEQNKKVLVTGFADDVRSVASLLSSAPADVVHVVESATDKDVPRTADIVLYAMSNDSGSSTQLHSLFVYIHDRVQSQQEYLVAIGDADLSKVSFPETSHLPSISLSELGALLR